MLNILLLKNLISSQQKTLQPKKKANLVSKTDFDDKLIGLNRKITSNKTKYLEVYYCFSTAIQLPLYIVKNFLDIK